MQVPALRKEEEASGRGEATVEESGERPAIGGRGRAVGGGEKTRTGCPRSAEGDGRADFLVRRASRAIGRVA